MNKKVLIRRVLGGVCLILLTIVLMAYSPDSTADDRTLILTSRIAFGLTAATLGLFVSIAIKVLMVLNRQLTWQWYLSSWALFAVAVLSFQQLPDTTVQLHWYESWTQILLRLFVAVDVVDFSVLGREWSFSGPRVLVRSLLRSEG